MRRIAIGVILIFTFSTIFTAGLFAASKPVPPKIDIKKVNLESEEKGIVPSGTPLMILVEVNASEDIAQPLVVSLELRRGKDKQSFKESIEKIGKGMNSFKWALTDKPEDGQYSVSVNITCKEPKLKDRYVKSFRVGENKKEKKPAKPEKPAEPQTKRSKSGKKGGEEEDKNTGDITVSGQSVKTVTIAGITFNGNFVQRSPGVYVVQGEIKPDGFPVSLGKAAGELIADKNRNRIEGQMYIKVIGFGKLIQITDLILSKTQIKFKGKFEEKVTIPVIHADVSLAKGIADFEISTKRLACQANGGVIIDVAVPKVGTVSFDIISGGGGFATSIPPEGISVSGEGAVTVPFEPPLEVQLEGSAEITKRSISGNGSATLFSMLEIASGKFDIGYNGIMTIDTNVGLFLKDYGVEANLADTKFTVDLPKRKLTAALSQTLKILELITIPGSVKGELIIDGKTKVLSVSGTAKIPLTGTPVAPEEVSAGIQNFLIKVMNYTSKSPQVELNGELAISVWTLAGFNGKITGSVLDGKGSFYLPPGLKQLLDIDKISLPVRIDLKSARIMGDLGGDIAGLAIKHFPLTGPKIIVKNDGVHLKGEIGIANVITIPLGDLVFTQTNSYTTINGDLGIGPFTVAEGNFTFPARANEGIGFSGKMGIPGLSAQRITGTIYRDGKVELAGFNKIAFVTVDSMAKYDVSKTGLHADRAQFGLNLGGAAKCSLAFTNLDIDKAGIRGRATGTFSNVLGVDASLRGDFSFDGQTVELSYPDTVTLCGIKVNKAKLTVRPDRVTGSGTITVAGKKKNVTITIENGVMKLKGPAGELIAEGMRIVDNLADTAGGIVSEEKETITEHGGDALDNLSRMSEPWIKEVVAAASAVKNIYDTIEKAVKDEVMSQVKTALDDLKRVVDTAVAFAKTTMAAAVDAVCNGIIVLVDGVQAIFSEIESKIPASYFDSYRVIKNKVIEKGNALKTSVVTFRDNTKAVLYDLTGTITAIYQGVIDYATGEANKAASKIKKEFDPVIREIDLLLTEIGQEVDLATSAAGDEAERHYRAARQKADILKTKADSIESKYKNKIKDLVSPYTKPIMEKIDSNKAKVAKERDAVVAKGIEALSAAKKKLGPVIKPFEDAVGELKDLAGSIGGAVYQSFLSGISAAGNAMNTALGTAGKGLIKATDIVGDAAVKVTGAAADASQAVYQAASATVNFVQDTGTTAINVVVDTAQTGYQTAAQAANHAATVAQQAASQAYQAATQVAVTAAQQVTSTVNTILDNLPSIPPSVFTTGAPVSLSDLQSGAQVISAKVSAILSTLDSYATSAYSTASSAASSVGSTVSSGASTVASGISSRWKKATGTVANLWGGTSSTPAPTVSYAAPEVTNIAATSTTTSITITYNTSFNSRTIIFYSATPNVNPHGQDAVTTVASKHTGDYYPETTSHSITISGLTSGTAYYYIVYAVHMTTDGNATNVTKKGPYMVVTQPSTAIIGGLVKDASGNAVSGANIYLGQSLTPVAVTDATGRYTVEVNPGAYVVSVKRDNYISSSATTASLSAGQVMPLDFTLADGRIRISGIVKDAATDAPLSSVSVTLIKSPNNIGIQTGATGIFTIVLGTTDDNPVQLSMNAAKSGYTTYTSSQISLSRGAKMENVEIKLPRVGPALSGNGVNITGITANQATVSFTTASNCSAFVQLGLQSAANYTMQTATLAGRSSFTFDLVSLAPATTYRYKVILQDDFDNNVIARESTFTTASAVSANTDIGLNATVTNITANSAKLNITSTFATLKHHLVLKNTVTNVNTKSQDLGLLVSPVSVDLNNLTDGTSYAVILTSSLLTNVTAGNVVKVASKTVNFQTPELKSIVIREFKISPSDPKRGSTVSVNATADIRINHAVNGAVLKVVAGNTQLLLQNLGNLTPGNMQVAVPLAVGSIPGNGPVAIKLIVQVGNTQESSAYTINISAAG